MDRMSFAAARKGVMEGYDEPLAQAAGLALLNWGSDGWWQPLVEAAMRVFDEVAASEGAERGQVLDDFRATYAEALAERLRETTEPGDPPSEGQVTRLAQWLSTSAVNAGTVAAAATDVELPTIEWVTMHDNAVRSSHRSADGQTVPLGSTFDIGGYDLHYPGEPVGPPDIWINCRCVVRPSASDAATVSSAAWTSGASPSSSTPTPRTSTTTTPPRPTARQAIPTMRPTPGGAREATAPRSASAERATATAPASVGGQRRTTTGGPDAPGRGGNMDEETLAAIVAAAEAAVDDAPDPEAPEITDDDLDMDVPWYGVLAPEGVPTGDRRKFMPGSLRYRDLPLPLRYQPTDAEGHDGSVVVGRIDNIWLEDGLHKASGVFDRSPEAEKVIGLLANRMLRGVSVDLDDTTVELQNDDGTAFDFEEAMPEDRPITAVTDGRIASAAICAIPAFQEAFVAIGRWEDAEAEAREAEFDESLAASGDCTACDVVEEMAAHDQAHADAFAAWAEEQSWDGGSVEWMAPDGSVYALSADGVSAFAPGTKDGPGWITNPVPTARIRRYWVRGKGAAKIRWGVPGDFNRCRRQLAKYVKNPDWLAGLCSNMHKEALGVWPGQEGGGRGRHSVEGEAAPAFSLVASAGPVYRGEWFGDPNLQGPTPLTVTEDGQVYGHVATWGTCHIGMPGTCTTPPRSESGYSYFRTGVVDTDLGEVAVGHITMGTGHADLRAAARPAAEHYDNTGATVAYVAAGEDDYGIWVAGAIRDGVPDEQVAALRASGALSGDWRRIGLNYEMVAALAVNVPGFPIPRLAIAASAGEQTALVASGIVTEKHQEVTVTVSVESVRAALAQIAAEDERAARIGAVKSEARAQRLALIREGVR